MIDKSQLKFPTAMFQSMEDFIDSGYMGDYSFSEILDRLEISEQEFRDPNVFLNGHHLQTLLDIFSEQPLHKPQVFAVMDHISLHNMGLGGIAVNTAYCLADSMDVLLTYYKLLIPAIYLEFLREGSSFSLILGHATDFGKHNPLIAEICLGGIKRFADEITGEALPMRLEFKHAPLIGQPKERVEQLYQDYFKCEVRFGCTQYNITGDYELLAVKRVRESNQILFNATKQSLEKSAKKYGLTVSVAEQARSILYQAAQENRYPDLYELADMMNMSARTLSRKLAKDNVKFKTLSNEARFNKAMLLLRNTNLSTTKLAARLGYSNSEAFIKAFKHHTGTTPKQWKHSA